jgi:hypothetical protein
MDFVFISFINYNFTLAGVQQAAGSGCSVDRLND